MRRNIRALGVLWALLLVFTLVSCTSKGDISGTELNGNGVINEITEAAKEEKTPDEGADINTPFDEQQQKNPGTEIKIHYIDVGQADSILIQLAGGRNVLIDGGNRGDAEVIDQYLRSMEVKTIDYLIATHPHEDHIGGLPYIVRNYDIAAVYMPKVTANTRVFEELLNEIKAKDLKINTAAAGVSLIDSEETKLFMLAPKGTSYEETNEYSAVLKLVYKDTSFIFTGDAEAVSEGEMLKSNSDLSADVLKVGHHGGRTSTTAAFLKQVSPEYAIISVGRDNDYGHPHKETVDRLFEAGAKVYRTDDQGTIVVSSDGREISIDKTPAGTSANLKKTDAVSAQFIGNKNSRIFHLPSCNSLPDAKNQIKLKSRDEALSSGYKACKICKP